MVYEVAVSQLEQISVVIPTYGGRDTLRPLIERLTAVLGKLGNPYELIVVNDSSPDDSWQVLQELVGEHADVTAIDLLHNHGQMRATICGMAHASGDIVVTMDDDLQHPPEELPKLLAALRQHSEWDAVVGAWPRDEGWFRDFGSWVFAKLDRLAWRTPRGFRHSGFRAIRRPVVDAMLAHETRLPVLGTLVRQCSDRVYNVEVEHHQRAHGSSGFSVGYGVRTVFKNFFQGSTLPLRVLSRFGFVSALVSAGLAVALLIRWVQGSVAVAGWTSSLLAIVFFGGAALFGLGILGEYTHLLMGEVRRPPKWNIRKRLDAAADVEARRLG
jgi:dolichol-phosphate mannosyltransferase/undecaprenyl-phosphate 4-deoxy-4-formamido-L-arabinose transferase